METDFSTTLSAKQKIEWRWLVKQLAPTQQTKWQEKLQTTASDEVLEAGIIAALKQRYYAAFVFEKTVDFTDDSPETKKFDANLFNEVLRNGWVAYHAKPTGCLGAYLAEFFAASIAAYPQLTAAEKDALVLRHEKLIYQVIHETPATLFSFVQKYDLFDDLVGVGQEKLRIAAESFEKDHHRPFTAYAKVCLRRAIDHAIQLEIRQQKERVHSQKMLENENLANQLVADENVEADCVLSDTLAVLHQLLQQLSEKEQFIIFHTYGLDHQEKLNQEQIAAALHETQPTISKQKKHILQKLKTWCEAEGITDLEF